MAIRITGMYSGLDTEAIIDQLASAQSLKKNKLVKAQTKLSWKQDAWKALNTKIYSFYTNVLDNMRWQGSYMKKATTVSNTNAVSIVTSSQAPNSVQSLEISKLARQGYMTSARVSAEGGKEYTATSTLADMGFTGEGSFRVKVGNKTTDITLTEDMKISDVVRQFESAGLTANFDAKNQRFYLSAKESGAAADFTITSNDAGGQAVLSKLGLITAYNRDSNEYKEYEKWAKYGTIYGDGSGRADAEAEELAKLIASKKASTDRLLQSNENLEKQLADLREAMIDPAYTLDYDDDKTRQENADTLKAQAEALFEELYGPEVDKVDDKGQPIKDDQGNPVKERRGGLQAVVDAKMKDLTDAQQRLEEAKKSGGDVAAAEADVVAASQALTTAQSDFNKKNGHYSFVQGASNIQNQLVANDKQIADNREYYVVDANGDPELDADKNLQATTRAATEITQYFDSKIAAAEAYMAAANAYLGQSAADQEAQASQYATKVDGRDAEIYLNNVKYTNSKNTFEINGLTITAQQETAPGETITLTTAEDADGIYDMIKNFFTEYNKLVNEMSALYNADSAKGYDPLLSEEKAGLADSEIEEWEKKIKDSLLRRDATLSDVSSAMRTVMMQGATVNGKTMYLSDFGINTLGYFNAADNEKNAYHINGDKDDSNVANEDDLLRQMIAADPDTVMNFFSSLSQNLYSTLSDKMKSIPDTSSAFTVYNDKLMQKEYDDYKDKIKKEEDKLNALMDKWYAKFSAMETAMAKLQSKNNAISGMLGGGA
ncbi:MAG: flagellar filament capping protein FliD [Lachnospiraceae bacterium]|nr:flagellar filament capping protein FliD [Lachnospiraceae bacterium]